MAISTPAATAYERGAGGEYGCTLQVYRFASAPRYVLRASVPRPHPGSRCGYHLEQRAHRRVRCTTIVPGPLLFCVSVLHLTSAGHERP